MKTSLFAFAAAALLFTSCASNNVDVDNSLGRFFDSAGVKGCFALLDNGQGRFTIYNLPRYRDSLYAPGATFDIPQLLIGFQTGVVKDGNDVLISKDSAVVDTIRHLPSTHVIKVTLTQAFKSMNLDDNATFQDLAFNLGIDTLKKWVDSLHYGNNNVSGNPSDFWNDDTLKITPDEQLGLIKKLYFNQLPFFRRPQDLVKDMMVKETNSNFQLVYKTARIEYPSRTMGWVMGWVEENKHPYFFVLHIEAPGSNADVTTIGLQLVKRILAGEGFFQGKK